MKRLSLEGYARGVLAGDRGVLARAITLVESTTSSDRALARELLARLWPRAGGAHRLGITGVPGVGKSTFIEAFGRRILDAGQRIAVLAVDPSSARSGGSILGDKTRMPELSRHPGAFVRPSPSRGALGGVAADTRKAMILCDAAGYDWIFVETVGVGQSEVTVAAMVDFFLVLVLGGAGDELQGIKRGVLELADLVAVTKADGEGLAAARRAQQDYALALQLMPPATPSWTPSVRLCSALTGEGLAELSEAIAAHRSALEAAGQWEERRRTQRLAWFWEAIESALRAAFRERPEVAKGLGEIEGKVLAGEVMPEVAAESLVHEVLDGEDVVSR